MSVVTRFAPSPTGLLHLGHAHSALFAWRAAQAVGGSFLLRIEDIDPGRCREEFVGAIERDLAWLGLDWPRPARRQSEHMDDYRAALARLDALGVLYRCVCTRKDIQEEIARAGHAPHGPDGALYPGTCRGGRVADDDPRPYALRIDVAKASALAGRLTWRDLGRSEQIATPETLGDVTLARKDAPASYHLCVTVDDASQGVTLVTRGEDLFHATHMHRLLQALLDLPTPDYHHHGLLRNERGERLSKRDRAVALADLRDAGETPAEVRAMAGFPDRVGASS